MEDREARLQRSISEWYEKNPDKLQQVRGIVCKNKGGVSLRVLEHFVTNYAPKLGIVLPNPKRDGDLIDVYWSYKEELKCFHKSLFDPFCRTSIASPGGGEAGAHKRDARSKQPSLRQLNFFRWAIRTGVLEYVAAHMDEVLADINAARNRRKLDVESVPNFSSCCCHST